MTTSNTISPEARPRPGPASTRRGGILYVVAALAAAWAVPALAQLLHVGWVSPLLIWIGTAALIRAGRTFLDRLVLAAALLVGATCAIGLFLSVWPWRLEPVPVAGLALTLLVLFAAAGRRRPQFGLRTMGYGELGVAIGTLICAALATIPFIGKGFHDRLGLVARGDDLARHFTVYDTIRVVEGFLFMHRSQATPYLDAGYEGYPQGIHFIYALLANFMPQGADRNDTIASFDLMLTFDIGMFAFLCLAVLWACRWVAGPLLRGWVAVPFLLAVAGYLFFGDPVTMLTTGFPSEMAGLALVAVLVAIVIRPTARFRDQCLLVVSLLVGLSFTYFLFLPFGLLLALVWAVQARRKLWQHRWTVALIGVLGVALVMISPIANVVTAPASVGDRLLYTGAVVKVDRPVVLAWTCLAVAGAVAGWIKGARIWRTAAIVVALGLVPVVGLASEHIFVGQSQTYYLEKLLHEMLITAVVAAGGVLMLLRRPFEALTAGRRRVFLRIPVVALAVGLFVATTALEQDGPIGSGRSLLAHRAAVWDAGRYAVYATHLYPHADGRVTWVQLGSRLPLDGRYAAHWATLYTAVLQRNYKAEWSAYFWGDPWTYNTDADMTEFLMTSPSRYRFLINDTQSFDMLTRIATRHPELDLQIVDLRNRRP